MSVTQQQERGAQRAAAGRVRQAESEFQQTLRTVQSEADALRPAYQGPAATAFFQLIGSWLLDAEAIVRDMEGFAGRLEAQESQVKAEQDASASTFSRAASALAMPAGR